MTAEAPTLPTPTESSAPQAARLESAQKFVEAVRGLGTGDLAMFRRNAGVPRDEARGVEATLYRLLDGHGRNNEAVYYLVATLVAFDKAALMPRSRAMGDLGRSLAVLAQETTQESVTRRFRILLDADLDKDGSGEMVFRLRQMVKLLLSKEIPINWARLLVDLRDWQYPESVRRVRRRWALHFYDRIVLADMDDETSLNDSEPVAEADAETNNA